MKFIKVILFILILLSFTGCLSDGGTVVGNPQDTHDVKIAFAPYSLVAHNTFTSFLIPFALADVNNLTYCFKRLRFKKQDLDTVDPDSDDENIDFDIGEVSIDSNGTFLGSIKLQEGTYERLEFDLENQCAGAVSVDLFNDQGNFQTTDRITIKFKGTLNVSETKDLNLDISEMMNLLDRFDNSGSSLKDVLEGFEGTL